MKHTHSRRLAAALILSLAVTSLPVAAEENTDPAPHEEQGENAGDVQVTTPTSPYSDGHQEADGLPAVSGILLVNKKHSLPADYAPCGPDQSNTLYGEADQAAKDFIAAANAQGYSMYMLSGYRSYSVQRDLFARYAAQHGEERANTYSARAGQSDHQTGLVFDVGDNDHPANNLETSMDQFPGTQWMMAHCADYGFIVRFPKGKEAITGYQYEPWHYRYVGKNAAKEIMSRGITLEEFLGDTDSGVDNGRRIAIGRNDNRLNVDGAYSEVASYNIGGNNYFRLRDLATILTGTSAAFNVGYDSQSRHITLTSHAPMTESPTLVSLNGNDVAVPNGITVLADGAPVLPAAYNINGFTYFKLRDLGQLLGFTVDWDSASKSMVVTTQADALLTTLLEPVTIR
ncbi:MAG: D-alanyl-D-alanine carboxypeptidase family protein [Peptococcaceae bacterium]|nr:D-alanyl-D-alanine carboxypeptidase family protein [Peptococcaceae bacterium]